MDTRNIVFTLPKEVLNLIFTYFNNNDLHSAMATCRYFIELFHDSNLLSRPRWHWVNHAEISATQEIANPCGLYDHYPLRNGDMAFALTRNYVYEYHEYYLPQYTNNNQDCPLPNWKNHQAILVLCTGMEQPVKLIGHEGGVRHVMQHNANLLASIGLDNTIRIWEKLTGIQKCVINIAEGHANPFYLLSLSNEEIMCLHENGTAHAWHALTGEYIREIFNIPEHHFLQCIRQENVLFLHHHHIDIENPGLNSNNHFTVWDIEEEKIIKTINLAIIKHDLCNYVNTTYANNPKLFPQHLINEHTSKPTMYCRDYHSGIAIIDYNPHTCCIYDTNNEKVIFCCSSSSFQYKFLSDGNLVLIHRTTDGWHVLSDYCSEIGDFKIKYSEIDDNDDYFSNTDKAWVILHNGNVVTYDWTKECSSQWCLSTQTFLPEFQLARPSIPLHMQTNCSSYYFPLQCLPNDNILACADDGMIAIWEGETGRILLNTQIANLDYKLRQYIQFPDVDSTLFPNGDIYLEWSETTRHFADGVRDCSQGMILRFNLFQKRTETKTNNNIADNNTTNSLFRY